VQKAAYASLRFTLRHIDVRKVRLVPPVERASPLELLAQPSVNDDDLLALHERRRIVRERRIKCFAPWRSHSSWVHAEFISFHE